MKPELAVVARRQRGVFRRAQAVAAGHGRVEIDRLLRRGTWNTVLHGIYTAHPYDEKQAQSNRPMHLLAAAARLLAVGGDIVVSHESAAVWHDIQLLAGWPKVPTITRCRGERLTTARGHAVAAVPAHHRTGVVTTAARTVVDCARTLDPVAGFVTVESALWNGLDRTAITRVLEDCRGWPGVARARDLVALADEHSETALESLARLWCRDNGLPPPQQQRSVRTLQGLFLAEVDFIWEEFRTVLETDGRKKYEAEGHPEKGVAWQEKLREDRLRDRGLEVVRGYWSDGDDGGADLAARLRRAFARGQRATGPREYVVGPSVRPRFQSLAPRRPDLPAEIRALRA
ncbi:MAG: hypothetical protein QOE05_829 [Actinomycetota bacterium]|jgi:hypothetical protein|nr:hypothetical protein [Actinomycetota bacterium]